jgi:hypothetical protein
MFAREAEKYISLPAFSSLSLSLSLSHMVRLSLPSFAPWGSQNVNTLYRMIIGL